MHFCLVFNGPPCSTNRRRCLFGCSTGSLLLTSNEFVMGFVFTTTLRSVAVFINWHAASNEKIHMFT